MKARKAFLLALPLVGLAACESDSHALAAIAPTTVEAITTTVVVAPTTTKPPKTTAPPTTKAPTTTRPSQFSEVSVVPGSLLASPGRYSGGFFDFVVKADNHSSKVSDYSIKHACYLAGVQVDTGYAEILAVAPGASGQVSTICFHLEGVDEVRIISVERDSTVGRS